MDEKSAQFGETMRASMSDLVSSALAEQDRMWPGLMRSFTSRQIERTREDTRYHFEFLASAIWMAHPEIFTDYAVWCRELFRHRSIPLEWLTGSLGAVGVAVDQVLGPESAEAAKATLREGLDRIGDLSVPASPDEAPPREMSPLAQSYLAAALAGDRHGATSLLASALASGVPLIDLYTTVLQPVQVEVGNLWFTNKITPGEEHLASAMTQWAMSTLYPRGRIGSDQVRPTVVAACVGREPHEIGLRMVSDVFALGDWTPYFLGANVPSESIVTAVDQRDAKVLALSATMSYRVPDVVQVIKVVRSHARSRDVRILVGGHPFDCIDNLWREVGADAYAANLGEVQREAAEMRASIVRTGEV